jgi:hypothetical protein
MKLPNTPVSLAGHPCLPYLAAGLVFGGVATVNCATSSLSQVIALPGSMRAVAYSSIDTSASCSLYAGSDEGKVYELRAEMKPSLLAHCILPENKPVSRIASIGADGLVAVGDDEGGLHLFDFRSPSKNPIASVLEQADYISSIQKHQESSLVVASGDGTLCVYDLRMPPRPRIKLLAATPSFEDDLLSLTMFGAGLAVGGTLSGALHVYNMKLVEADEDEPDMARFVDRFYGHPESVSAILPYESQGIVLTGSSDGLIRVVEPKQKSFLGILPFLEAKNVVKTSRSSEMLIPRHALAPDEGIDEDEGSELVCGSLSAGEDSSMLWPVEDMVFVNGMSKGRLATIGHSSLVRFSDLSILDDSIDASEDDGAEHGSDASRIMREKDVTHGNGLLADNASNRQVDGPRSKRRKGKSDTSHADQVTFFAGL